MKDIPIDANVECTDGACGKSIVTIVDPQTHKVTHFVVEDETLPHPPYQRMVAVDQVVETSRNLIRLGCTRDEVSKMKPYVRTDYIPREGHDYTMYDGGEYQGTQTTTFATYKTVDAEQVPEGELVVRPGTRVRATDGQVGHVAELLADEDTGELSYLVLEEGHLWGKKEVWVPTLAIDRVEGDTVYLKLDKHGIETLPAVPARRHGDEGVVRPTHVELLARVFDTPEAADEALEFVQGLHRGKVIKILNAAVLVKAEDGTVTVHDTKEMAPKKGALVGAITGGLIGLIGGPIGAIVGAVAGAGAGGLSAKWIDMGFSDEFLDGLDDHLQPGSSALVILAEDRWVKPMSESLDALGGVVFRQTITDELAKQLLAESGVDD